MKLWLEIQAIRWGFALLHCIFIAALILAVPYLIMERFLTRLEARVPPKPNTLDR